MRSRRKSGEKDEKERKKRRWGEKEDIVIKETERQENERRKR